MQYSFLPVFLFVLCMIGLGIALLIVSALANPGRPGRVMRMPYESGMDPIHDTRRRFDVRFHLVAIAFLVFDVELLFLYPWAVAWRPAAESTMAARIGGSDGTMGSQEATFVAARPSSSAPSSPSRAPIDRDVVFGGVMVFLLLLTLGFVYDWRKGVFRWR